MTNRAKTLLVIGRPATGKTHYGMQLLGRLRQRTNKLKVRANPESIAVFETGLQVLSQGITADRTPTDVYESVLFPLQSHNGQAIDLIWPDYGGEQISKMVDSHRLSFAWQQRIIESSGWLLFIRLEHNTEYQDVQSRPASLHCENNAINKLSEFQWSADAFYTELLQVLLYAKGIGTIARVKSPALVILLSCWDELELGENRVKPRLLQLKK